eukprot:gene3352-3841_t
MESPAKLTPEDVIVFLKENEEFTEDYFIDNANASMIEKWFDKQGSRARNGHFFRRHSSSKEETIVTIPEQVLYEEDNSQEIAPASGDKQQQGPRRNSEPVATKTKAERQAAFKLRDMRKKRAISQQSKIHHNLGTTESNYVMPYDSTPRQRIIDKPSLRKTQSAPIYKSILSRLINSTVYLNSSPTRDMRSKLDLRSSSEDAFLTEIIHDVLKDLHLDSLCSKVVVNVGIITNAYDASLYLIEKVDQKRLLRTYYENHVLYPSRDDLSFFERRPNMNKLKNIDEDDLIGQVARSGETKQTKAIVKV